MKERISKSLVNLDTNIDIIKKEIFNMSVDDIKNAKDIKLAINYLNLKLKELNDILQMGQE